MVQTLKEKDHSLFDIWRKKIPKAMLAEKEGEKSKRILQRNMTMQISIQNLAAMEKNMHVEELYDRIEKVNESDGCVNIKQNELYQLINSVAKIEGSTRQEFKNACTIYFEEVGVSLINFVDITG